MNAVGESKPRALTRAEYERYSPMIRRQAMWLARRGPRTLSVADLCAAGWSGLLDALNRTDEAASDGDIDGFASHRVKSAMLQHLETLDPYLKETRGLSRSIARAIAALSRTLARAPSENEIAEALSMTIDEYASSLHSVWSAGLARIEVIDLDRSVQQLLNEKDAEPTLRLHEAIDLLPAESQEILMLLYQENCSIDEAAAVLGQSVRRAEIRVSEAMHRVRALTGRE